jgi:hypothetical protein
MAATAIFHGLPVLKPGTPRSPPPVATTAVKAAPAATHAVPFQRQVPSGESVETHVWPSHNHFPSGETSPTDTARTSPG